MAPPVKTPVAMKSPDPVDSMSTIQRSPDSLVGTPLISIVIPSYNQGEYLEQTLLSILHQDYPRVEILIMDGGSTDKTVDILKRYRAYVNDCVSEPDGGQAAAIAKGFAKAKGDIFLWLASDDFLLPGALSAVAQYFVENPDVEVVTGGCVYVDRNGLPLKDTWAQYTLGVSASYHRLRFYEQDGVSQQSTFFRRSAYEAVGGVNPSLQFAMDYDLYLRLAKRKKFSCLSRFLACFRLHEESKSTRLQKVREREREEIAEGHGCNQYGPVVRGLLYWAFRIPSLIRKAYLMGLQLVRKVNLEKTVGNYPFDQPEIGEPSRLVD